jgi:4-amino-4-deoxy-L-arabinose transferase-like glycosyltransferase
MNSGGRRRFLALALTLLAFAVRVWQLDRVPPGWSDDELSNILVISQKVFRGNYSIYYVDATGLEALYHVVAGVMLRLFGYNAVGIRLLSAFLGTLTVPLTFHLGRRLRDQWLGLVAAAALAVSFWSLIYSRVNLRHIALPPVMLLAFAFFWRAFRRTAATEEGRTSHTAFLPAGVFLGISFYTYFAARGLPLILAAFLGYVWLFERARWRRQWHGYLLLFLVALLLALPLLAALQQAGADARVVEVAVPLAEARAGNLAPLREHVVRTLSMFHGDGDEEFLYNIPRRPVFSFVGAIFLWSGVLLALAYALEPLWRRRPTPSRRAYAAAFLLLWWFAGLTPGFLSVPAGSLGHTIVAQPATYLLAALPLSALSHRGRRFAGLALALLFLGSVAVRDLPDYFYAWPQRGNVRFLYHAPQKDVARYLQKHPELRDFAITGLLAGPWDRLALQLDMDNAGVEGARARWYDPRRAIVLQLSGEPALAFAHYPRVETVYDERYRPLATVPPGDYELARVTGNVAESAAAVCFRNGLCLLDARYEATTGRLHLTWQVGRPLALPATPLLSKPPPPGVYAGPRLLVFTHLLSNDGVFLSGDDGLWVDPTTLLTGDIFQQQHVLEAPAQPEAAAVTFGLYDPLTGERIPTIDGRDQLRLLLDNE